MPLLFSRPNAKYPDGRIRFSPSNFFTSFKLRSDWVFLPFLGVNFCKYDKSSYECLELSLHPKHKPSSSTSWKVTDFTLLFVLNILTQIPSDVFSFSSSHSCKSFLVSKDITFRFSCDPFNEAYSAAGEIGFGWWLVEHYLPYHVDCPDGCGLGETAGGG